MKNTVKEFGILIKFQYKMLNKRYSIRRHEWNGTDYPSKRKCTTCSNKNTRVNNDSEPRCIEF